MINKDIVKCKQGGMIMVRIKQKNTEQQSTLFCDEVHYLHNKQGNFFDHHIMIYNKKHLIFKAWLPNERKDKEFKDLKEALKSVGMEIHDKTIFNLG
jgi:4'-phosphopantetheinyl transferase EntD